MEMSKEPRFPRACEKQPVWARSTFLCSFLQENPFQNVIGMAGWLPVEPKAHAQTKPVGDKWLTV